MEALLKQVNSGKVLSFDEAVILFEAMASLTLTEAQIGSILIALKLRGETSDELAALVTVMNRHKKAFKHNATQTMDTCGTGGDGKSTVNVSTAVSIILASMGINVLKHGNGAQSGKVGSADVLKALGFDFGKNPESYFTKNNFVFLFAPEFHPALKTIGKVRRELKVPTLFNFVGPLINPGLPDYQMIWINSIDRLDFVASAALKAGKNRITFYSSRDGFDEISSTGITECVAIVDGVKKSFTIDAEAFFQPFAMPIVETLEQAVKLFVDGLKGVDPHIKNIFAINTALALKTMNKAELNEGFSLAKDAMEEGRAFNKLQSLIKG